MRGLLVQRLPAGFLPAQPPGDAAGCAVQETRQRFAATDSSGPARQYQEGRLKGVVGVMDIAQQAAADAEDERAVPLEKRGEGGFVALLGEAVQQLTIGQIGHRLST
jgi:hypothetical protein